MSGLVDPAVTRRQQAMTMAIEHISDVDRRFGPAGPVCQIYGGMAHKFPVLVRTSGLCQALAFVEAKAAGGDDRGTAYQLLADHIAGVLGVSRADLSARIREAELPDYIRYTRTVLSAWIFYKRFAVSILQVESAQAGEDDRS